VSLINPADIKRHLRFKKEVALLKSHGIIRHYTAEISRKTGESKGNITNYYKGIIPIGDNFLEKFEKAYEKELKVIRGSAEYRTDHPSTLAEQTKQKYGSEGENEQSSHPLMTDIERTLNTMLEFQIAQEKILRQVLEAIRKTPKATKAARKTSDKEKK